MEKRHPFKMTVLPIGLGVIVPAGLLGVVAIAQSGKADFERGMADPAEARAALVRATNASREAGRRAERFSAEAQASNAALDKTQRESAAMAARIQQTEADISATMSRLDLIAQQRASLNAKLADRRQPLVQLAAALQNMSRRPLAISALRPGSLKDTVYVRAVLETTLPQVQQQTSGLRQDIERGFDLERATNGQLAKLRGSEQLLAERRGALAALALKQQSESRQARSLAMREKDRALALAEEARDLGALVNSLSDAGQLRRQLAALPGPVLRPSVPESARSADTKDMPQSGPETNSPPALAQATIDLQLPVQGRTITGFGENSAAGVRSAGVVIAPVGGAQIVAPAAGRVAFSGPYRGFGRIVIIEHGDGWTSLITGLARSDVEVGAQLSRGSPIGVASDDNPEVTLELRREGDTVNPLEYL